MRRLVPALLILLGTLALAAVLSWWMLPTVVQALPGQVRVRLPEELVRAVTTPLPTALPAPSVEPEDIQLTAVSAIVEPVATPTVTPATAPTTIVTVIAAQPAANERFTATPTATPTKTPTATATVEPLPATVHLEGMEITPQSLNNCGPTNLSINLNYYGLETTQFDVAEIVKPHYDDRNVSPQELVKYANEYTDLQASLFSGGDLTLLKKLLAAGFPVVIEKGYEPDWQGWMGHYLTLIGYNEADATFLTMDTFLGPWDGTGRTYHYEEIEKYWEHFNNTFFLVYPPRQAETLLAIISPHLIDPVIMWQHAAATAQQSINDEPENAFAWFNLGSSYTELGQLSNDPKFFKAAATAFDQARLLGLPPRMLWYQFQPYIAYLETGRVDDVLTLTATIRDHQGGDKVEETFFYRGRALQALGNEKDAAFNYRRALEIKPGYQEAREALAAVAANR